MAAPRQDPETGGRSLAEILREAGIESPTRGRRRREDADDTGIRQRRAEPPDGADDTGGVGGRPYGRRASDLRVAGGPPPRAADPSTAAIPSVRPSGKPDVPGATAQTGVVRERRTDERRAPDRRAGEQRTGADRRQGERRVDDDRSTGRVGERRQGDRRQADRRPGDRRVDDDRSTGRVGERRGVEPRPDRRPPAAPVDKAPVDKAPVDRARADKARADKAGVDRAAVDRAGADRAGVDKARAERIPSPASPLDDNPVTGPIPVVTDEAPAADGTPKESALAWTRFAGELVIALAAGVGIYFLFTVIWETLPHLAVVVAPLAVTGLVAGVGAYRHKVARDPVGPKLLAVLVFAGTLLTVAPAAALLATG
jgi:hypothetical protein